MVITGELRIDCNSCIEDITVSVNMGPGLKFPLKSKIRAQLIKNGWHVGRCCFCPDCLANLEESKCCKTCKHWHNTGGYTPYCDLDDELALAQDTCENHA